MYHHASIYVKKIYHRKFATGNLSLSLTRLLEVRTRTENTLLFEATPPDLVYAVTVSGSGSATHSLISGPSLGRSVRVGPFGLWSFTEVDGG